MIAELTFPAPAQVNLALHVTGRRDDGYHLLDSLVVFTAYGDAVHVGASGADRFAIAGRYAAGIPESGGNLVLRARDLLRQLADGRPCGPVAIRLVKNLPVA